MALSLICQDLKVAKTSPKRTVAPNLIRQPVSYCSNQPAPESFLGEVAHLIHRGYLKERCG